MEVHVALDPSVSKAYPGFIGRFAVARGVKIRRMDEGLEATKKEILGELKSRYEAASITDIPEVVLFRSFFKAMGVDPSRFRSPPEYLLRRALGDRFPSVNNLVDICLLLTVKHWVAVGAFDLSRLKGRVIVTLAKGSESLLAIDGRTVALTPGEVILVDEEKIVSAYTVGDARATMVTEGTLEALVTLWNAPGIVEQNVNAALAELKTMVAAYASGLVNDIRPW